MASLEIDPDLCQGSGECVALAPRSISQDELGIAHVVGDVPDDLAARVVATCPSMAISLAVGSA